MQKKFNSKKIDIQSIFIGSILVILTIIISMQSCASPWYGTSDGTDTHVFRYVGWLMTKGYMPYVDTFDHKGPLIYIINYIGHSICYLTGVWVFEFIAFFITVVFSYKIARLLCGRWMSLLATCVAVVDIFDFMGSGNYVEEYAMPFITISFYIFIDYFLNERINKLRLIICGFSMGAVLMLRPNMISLWIIFSVTVLIYCIKRGKYRDIIKFLMYFLLGCAIIVVPIMLWLMVNGAFGEFIDQYIIFNFAYSSDEARANWYQKTYAVLYFFSQPMMMFSILISVIELIRKKNIFNIATPCYIILTVLLMAMSGKIHGHYEYILIPIYAYASSCFASYLEENYKKEDMLAVALVGWMLCTTVFSAWINATTDTLKLYYQDTQGVNRINQNLANAVSVIQQNTSEDDRISVFGNLNSYYLYSKRLSSSKYSYQFPIGVINPFIMDEYFKEIEENDTKLIIVTREVFNNEQMQEFLLENNYSEIWASEHTKIYKCP